MKTTPSTITATGSSSGQVEPLTLNGPDISGAVGVSGTFTTCVFALEGKAVGGSVYYPIMMRDRQTGLQNNGTFSPADSTATSQLFDARGVGTVRLYCVSGTPTSVVTEITHGQGSDFGGPMNTLPIIFTSASTFGAGIAMTGATGTNTLTMPDNLADAFSIKEGSNAYLTFVTTDSSEGISVKKDLTMASGVDLIFSGTTGQSLIKFPDNLASALVMGEGANAYITFVTTDSSEAITVAKTTTFAAGVVVKTGGTTAITTTRAVTRADAGGVFTTAQSSSYTITIAQPLAAGERYVFQCVSPGSFDISIVATGCTFEGTITIDAATIPATGSTLKFASGAAILGDNIEIISTSTTKCLVRAIGSGAGGITIT